MPVPKSCLSKDKDHPTDFCFACLKAEIERLRQFIIDAPCPHCDGSGGIRKEIAELKEKVAMYEGDDIPVVPQDKYLRLREIASSQDKGIERLKKQNTNLKSQVKLWKMRLEEAIKLYKKDGE